ncbi:MAG: iron-sulfur cluster-binding protein [Methyloversatilis sp.]|nr:iron-sulfur cluster-binding protein [Methyloversatilis sp.]
MEIRSMHFVERVRQRLDDDELQRNLKRTRGRNAASRAAAVAAFPDFDAVRQRATEIRRSVLRDLDVWLERFEAKATERGATVLWARDGEHACELIADIAKRHGVRTVVKSKSMVSEEAGLNAALEAAGVRPVETDLGEYILQINDNEPPSHVIMPVIHKSKEQVSELFARVHGTPPKTDIEALTHEARAVLRPEFLGADMGLSGGNFLIAETGSVAIVTNEGNGRLCTTLPRVHVALTGIEKVIPTLEDLSTLLRILPRSATGQALTNYVSMLTGPKHTGDPDGPEHMYFVLVDGGRADLLGSEFEDMLRCIRCGACMNHCPVYQTVGGHAYGWVYPGPMGSVLTPLYQGLEKAKDLPHAATLCNQCGVVCPVSIPLPELMRRLREKQVERGLRPWSERLALRAWAWVAARPKLYALASRVGVRYLRWLAGGRDRIQVMGLAPGWTAQRDFPAPAAQTFRELHAARQAAKRQGGAR